MIPMWTCKTAAPAVSLAVLGGSQRLLYAALKGAPPMIIDQRIGEDFTLFQLGTTLQPEHMPSLTTFQTRDRPSPLTSKRRPTAKRS
jgi:hypothetical protein